MVMPGGAIHRALSFFRFLGCEVDNYPNMWLDMGMEMNQSTNPTEEVIMDIASITYSEACAHAEANYNQTNGLVTGGGYHVDFGGDMGVRLAHIRVSENGIARLVQTETIR